MAGLAKYFLNTQFNCRAVTTVINRDFSAQRRGEMRRRNFFELAQSRPANIGL
jgi:hypothetical protein